MHRVLAWIQSLATVEYTVLDNVRVVFLLSKCFLLVFFLAKIVIHVCYAQHINSVLHSWREKKKKHKKKTCRRQWAACQTSSMWNRHLYHHCKPLRPFSHSHVELILNVLSCRVGVFLLWLGLLWSGCGDCCFFWYSIWVQRRRTRTSERGGNEATSPSSHNTDIPEWLHG